MPRGFCSRRERRAGLDGAAAQCDAGPRLGGLVLSEGGCLGRRRPSTRDPRHRSGRVHVRPTEAVSARCATLVSDRRLKDGRNVTVGESRHQAFAVYDVAGGLLVHHEMSMIEAAGTDRFRMEIYGTQGSLWLRTERGALASARAGSIDWTAHLQPDKSAARRHHRAWIDGLTGRGARATTGLDGLPRPPSRRSHRAVLSRERRRNSCRAGVSEPMISHPQIAMLSFAHYHANFWTEAFLADGSATITCLWDNSVVGHKRPQRVSDSVTNPTSLRLCPIVTPSRSALKPCIMFRSPTPLAPQVGRSCVRSRRHGQSSNWTPCTTMWPLLAFSSCRASPSGSIPLHMSLKSLIDDGHLGRVHLVRIRHGHYYGLDQEFRTRWYVDAGKRAAAAPCSTRACMVPTC